MIVYHLGISVKVVKLTYSISEEVFCEYRIDRKHQTMVVVTARVSRQRTGVSHCFPFLFSYREYPAAFTNVWLDVSANNVKMIYSRIQGVFVVSH